MEGTADVPTKRRSCVFCGRTSGFSKEHVWPQWLHSLGENLASRRWDHEAGFSQTAVDTFTEMPTVVTEKPGSVLTMKTREVCSSCNNGWMSQLERQIKPLILALMDAAVGGWSVAISPDEAARLSAWAVKTAWMRELSAGTAVDRSDGYHYLYKQLLPPPDCKVWLGRHAGELNFHIKQTSVQVRRSDRPWDHDDIRNVLWTCMTFRGLSLLVYTVDGWGVSPPSRDPNCWRPLWPQSMPIRFPARFDVAGDDVLEAVAVQSPAVRTPDLPVFVRDRDGTQYRRRN